MRLQEVVDWSLAGMAGADEPPEIVLTVDVAADPELGRVLADAATAGGRGFAGSWRAGTKDDTPIVSFLLLEDTDDGLERAWWTERLEVRMLTAATTVPHTVRLVPVDGGGNGLLVEVDHASARVTELLATLPRT
ncbi:hypothetical protein DSM112329_02725 [Paraconexibacter sp. AEG42_29]|uniref:Uncharacterized protein n=2 Tax=Paraconexibacter sp. AEG42_29 TaxID=2997339 RepID=A0AAU7AWN9_9ACTN